MLSRRGVTVSLRLQYWFLKKNGQVNFLNTPAHLDLVRIRRITRAFGAFGLAATLRNAHSTQWGRTNCAFGAVGTGTIEAR